MIVQVGRLSDGRRKLISLSELTGMEGEVITMQEIFRFRQTGRSEEGGVIGLFEATGIRPKFCISRPTAFTCRRTCSARPEARHMTGNSCAP